MHLGPVLAQPIGGSVTRAIVHDDHLEVPEALSRQRGQDRLEQVASVVGEDGDGQPRSLLGCRSRQ